jgi:hypothetical protein
MIELYTSCFSRIRTLPPSIEPVSIARWPARNFRGRRIYTVAPPPLAMKAKTHEEYDALYFPIFHSLDPHAFLTELTAGLAPGCEAIAMLCFCEPLDYCHRRYVAEWLEQNIDGLIIPEYGFEREQCETFTEWT